MIGNKTDEFSFLLKPSSIPGAGIGVFAAHTIAQGTLLQLFGPTNAVRHLKKEAVPEIFKIYCGIREDGLLCPEDFSSMPVGWYLNHSSTPNAGHHDPYLPKGGYTFYSLKDIVAGEEITIDYNSLGEPEEEKEEYYKK